MDVPSGETRTHSGQPIGADDPEPGEDDALAARIERWISEHPARAYAQRFPVDDVRTALAERSNLRAERDRLADALELLLARIHRDFNFDASESAPPDDEYWARLMDDLVRHADELYQPIADAFEPPPSPTTTPTAPHAKH